MAGLFDALQPVFLAFVLGEPNVSGATEPQRSYKGFDLAPVTGNGRKVDLHLLARRRLKANHGIGFDGFEVGNIVLEPANPAGIAAILNLSQQHGCRNPVRLRRFDPRQQIVFIGIQISRSLRSVWIGGHRA